MNAPLLNPGRSFTLLGVLNVTPDSFSDGGRFAQPQAAVAYGLRLREAGADWVDVGGESTRPGADPVAVSEELRRVLPVVEALAAQGVPVSIDTRRAEVAQAALAAGAGLLNDVSALAAPGMLELAVSARAHVLLMHMRGDPKTMQKAPRYDDVALEVRVFLAERRERAIRGGIPAQSVAIDPGIGFGKTLEHSLELIARLGELAVLGSPVAVGLSRKSFLGVLTGATSPAERLVPSLAAAVCAYRNGARIFRVHDVRETRDALLVAEKLWTERTR